MKIDDLLNEEEYDYYRDYKNGLISHEEYQQLVKQFQQREKERGWEKRAHDRGPWYIEIDGKIYKQKGVPKSFDWESGARKYALAIMKNRPDLQGKIALTKHLPNDTHQGIAEDHDQGERMDEMAMGELHNIAKNAEKIYKMLQQGRQLDTWEYSYITTANDHLTTVAEVVATSELEESASAGATSSANVGTVVSPQIAIGKKNIGNKGYTGSPGKSGTKAPKPPKIVQRKNKDGTAKNGLDEPNLFGGGSIKRR